MGHARVQPRGWSVKRRRSQGWSCAGWRYRSWQDHDGSPTRGCLLQGPRSDGGRDGRGLR